MSIIRTDGRWLLTLSLLVASCGDPAEVAICDPGEGEAVRMLDVKAITERAKAEGTNLSVPIQVSAHVPCLRGGLRANLRASVGMFGSLKPGDAPLVLFLAPTGTMTLGDLIIGEANLSLPPGRESRIDVEIGETTKTITVGPL